MIVLLGECVFFVFTNAAHAETEGIGFEQIAASIAREFGEPWEAVESRRGQSRAQIMRARPFPTF
jgi:hypothetical protein